MNKDKVYILKNRSIFYINGYDAKEFLQGLITNDIDKVTENNSCFAALLSPQGKFLYEFIIVKNKEGYFLDCEKDQANDLYDHLNFYKLRSKVNILNLSNEFVVAAFDYEKFLSLDGARDVLGFTFRFREDPIILDPRHKKLGARLIINLEKLYLSLKKLNLKDTDVKEYYFKSYELGIIPKNLNKLQNKIFGIECNYEELNGIDFKKGCYIGQENTSRIKLKNKLNKRVFPIEILDGKLKEGDTIKYNELEMGKVLIEENFPFAIFKISDKNFKINNIYLSGNAKLRLKKPNWLNI